MKKIVSLLLAMLMALSLAACGSSGSAASSGASASASKSASNDVANDPKVTLTYAEVNPQDSLMGSTADAFKQKVEELTGGSVTIDVQYSGVLGAESDVLDTMIGGGGTIDIARVATFSLTSYGAKETSLLSVPYTFENRAHFWKFAASDLGTQILNEPEKVGLGVRGLFYAEEGFRNFFFKDPVTGIQDLAGKKIRVSNDPTMTGMVQGLGASPTVVSFTELYTSLSSGVVDGAEQPIANYKSNAFNEVAPYMILDGHTLGCAEVIVTDSAWGKLTDAQKAAIQEAGKYASDFNANLSEKNENDCIDALKAAGVTFIQVTDIQAWKDACKDVIAQCTQGMETEYQAICDMAK